MEASSIREMAEQEQAEGESGQLFPGGIFEGDELSLRDMIKSKHWVKATVSFRSAEFASSQDSGLLRPTKKGFAIIGYQWEKPEVLPQWEEGKTRDEDPEIVGWKVRQILKPITIEKVDSEADAIQANYALLLDGDPAQAAKLLDELREMTAEKLGSA